MLPAPLTPQAGRGGKTRRDDPLTTLATLAALTAFAIVSGQRVASS